MRKPTSIYVVPAEVPDWYYCVGHEGPGCYRRADLIAMGYWPYERPPAREHIVIPGARVWYVGQSGESPYKGVVFSVDDPDLFPNSMTSVVEEIPYCPPRGLLAPNSLRAATDWIGINRMGWPERIICAQSSGDVLVVTYHHWGNGRYRRKRRKK